MWRWSSLIAASLAACSIAAVAQAPRELSAGPAEQTGFVGGLSSPEDLVALPGTPWIIAGSYPRSGRGDLYLIDRRTHLAHALDAAAAPSDRRDSAFACPSPPDPATFVAHGLYATPIARDRSRLFVVNHGGREAIEIFEIDALSTHPSLRWTGCVVAPPGVEPNSVVSLPDGGLMFTTLYDPGDRDFKSRFAKLESGAPAGAVFEWHKTGGFIRVALPPISGPNGIEISKDGHYLFVAGYGDGRLIRIDRSGRESPKILKLDFLPDNVHRAPDGTMVAAGIRSTVADIVGCALKPGRPTYCVPGWHVVAVDGRRMQVVQDKTGDGGGRFGDVTAAIEVGKDYWLGSISGDRIAVTPR